MSSQDVLAVLGQWSFGFWYLWSGMGKSHPNLVRKPLQLFDILLRDLPDKLSGRQIKSNKASVLLIVLYKMMLW